MSSTAKVTGSRAAAVVLAGMAVSAMGVAGSAGCDKAEVGPLPKDDPYSEDCVLCCTEADFQVGGTITGAGGVAAQAVADFASVAAASIQELTAACRSIAEDLDISAEERQSAEQSADKRDRMDAYCSLAISAIGMHRAEAGGALLVDVGVPVCETSVRAKADCQARCAGGAPCDLQANPPLCEGGALEIACFGDCTAASATSVACEGTCLGSCVGACTAQGGVDCAGRCKGICSAGAAGNGIQADGTCQGTCLGTCEETAPNASCAGTCRGHCDSTCQGSAGSSVRCDGTCDASNDPIKCIGGELEGGCAVEAKCEASCNASVTAKAECKPPAVEVDLSGASNVEAAGKLALALETNLGLVAALAARSEGMASVAPTFAASVDAETLADMKTACIPVVISAMAAGAMDAEAAQAASANVLGAVR